MDNQALAWECFLPGAELGEVRSQFAEAYRGQVVLVTGAGGFIGQALIKALAAAEVRQLILLDSAEWNLFEINRHLESTYPHVARQSVLGSVEDRTLLEELFERSGPQIVLHAAAYKHVAMLERNPFAAIRNNVLGTYALAQIAGRYRIPLLLVSTDKAARPHSVMGVSKRIAELLVISFSSLTARANAIRLANVIGSTGSVVPIIMGQLARGEPVIVTNPEATRCFSTVRETVDAILAAGIAPCRGRILLPTFRTPVNIAQLAHYLTRGKMPVHFVGLSAGEKLTEDLLNPCEREIGTVDGPLSVIESRTLSMQGCDELVEALARCLGHGNLTQLVNVLCLMVPEYLPSSLMQEQR